MVYEAKVSTKINVNYIMVHAKEILNPVFPTTRNHFEIEVKIEVRKPTFKIHLAIEGQIQKLQY